MNQDYSVQIGATETKIRELLAEVTKLREMAEECGEGKPHQKLVDKFLKCRRSIVGWRVIAQRYNNVVFERAEGRIDIRTGGYSGPKFYTDNPQVGPEISVEELEVVIDIYNAMRGC